MIYSHLELGSLSVKEYRCYWIYPLLPGSLNEGNVLCSHNSSFININAPTEPSKKKDDRHLKIISMAKKGKVTSLWSSNN